MTDGLVLVHGGMNSARAWTPLLPHLTQPAVAVDLPGRGARPAALDSVTLDDCVAAVLEEADAAGFDCFALVGHSLGGVTITEVAYRHPERVSHLVYVGALIPGPGQSAAQLMTGGDLDAVPVLAEETARALFGTDLDDAAWAEHYASLVPDAPGIINARVSGYPSGLPITYVSMLRDQPVPPALAATVVANIGGDVDVRTIDTGHTVMVSDPEALAAILDEVVAR